jgi:hypothetical protein
MQFLPSSVSMPSTRSSENSAFLRASAVVTETTRSGGQSIGSSAGNVSSQNSWKVSESPCSRFWRLSVPGGMSCRWKTVSSFI